MAINGDNAQNNTSTQIAQTSNNIQQQITDFFKDAEYKNFSKYPTKKIFTIPDTIPKGKE
jgi:hypothetical protein